MEQIEIDLSYSRLPIILLVDNSALMGEDDKIGILNNALIDFKKFIEEDEYLCKRVEICTIAFGNRVTVEHYFSSIYDYNPPVLQAKGPSLMGAGILKALAILMSRKYFYKKNAIEYLRPYIVFIVGSAPDDFSLISAVDDKRWDEIRETIKDDIYYKRYYFIPFAVIPDEIIKCQNEVNIDVSMKTVSSDGWASIKTEENHQFSYLRIINTLFPLQGPLRIFGNQTDYKELNIFAHIADDHTQSNDSIESPVTLPPIEGWAEITLDDDIKEIKEPDNPNILGASMIGPLHIINGIPCQDAYAYEILPSGHVIIAIADGLGSATMSEIGSRIVVAAAAEAIKNKTTDEIKNSSLSSLARDSVVAARKALEEKALALQCALRDLACTFISVVIHGDSLVVAHIGDGAVVAKRGEDLFIVSDPGDSEYANEVTPLSSKKWEQALSVTPVYSGISGLMAFSDGLQRAALRKSADRRIPNKAFCGPLFTFAEETTDVHEGEKELKEFLSSKKMADHSEDDKTLIFVTLTNNKQEINQ